jgi:hypothetical protein
MLLTHRKLLNLSPPATLRWSHDVFGNSIAIASFAEPSAELRIESSLQLETGLPDHSGGSELSLHLFSADDRIDLGRMLERHHPDPADRL